MGSGMKIEIDLMQVVQQWGDLDPRILKDEAREQMAAGNPFPAEILRAVADALPGIVSEWWTGEGAVYAHQDISYGYTKARTARKRADGQWITDAGLVLPEEALLRNGWELES